MRLDSALVEAVDSDTSWWKIVYALIELAHAYEMEVVVAGIETEGALVQLRALGCDLVEGSLWSGPQRADELGQWLGTWFGARASDVGTRGR
jgi:EAL domain-containing protein (putative c-di-GMP-specific phosphodiesterase class I)